MASLDTDVLLKQESGEATHAEFETVESAGATHIINPDFVETSHICRTNV